MKKFLKFLASLVAIASVIGGAYYVVKNFILNDSDDDFGDFDDDFDDFDDDIDTSSDNRGYVTLNSGEDNPSTEPDDDADDDLDETVKKEETTETNTTEENDFLIEE